MFHDYYVSEGWFAMKDFIKALAGEKCEYCQLRRAEHLHHLHYERFGHEHPADVLSVCSICHQYFHRRLRQRRVQYRAGSPFHQGLLGGELLEYLIQRREDQWDVYRERLEAMAEV